MGLFLFSTFLSGLLHVIYSLIVLCLYTQWSLQMLLNFIQVVTNLESVTIGNLSKLCHKITDTLPSEPPGKPQEWSEEAQKDKNGWCKLVQRPELHWRHWLVISTPWWPQRALGKHQPLHITRRAPYDVPSCVWTEGRYERHTNTMERGKGNSSHYSNSKEAPWPAWSIQTRFPLIRAS